MAKKKSTSKNLFLRDESISQPSRILATRDHPQSSRGQFDRDKMMPTRTQDHRRRYPDCANKGKTPTIVSHRTNKRIYNGCASYQQASNMVSHQQFMDMPLGEKTSMSHHPYDLLGEEARIEKELINGSYELDNQIMARLWEESRSEDELTNENWKMNCQHISKFREESRVEDEIVDGSYDQEREQGEEIADISMKKVRGPTYMENVWGRPINLQRHHVEYNEFGQPIGGESSMLTHFLGSIARNGKYCPIDVKDWHAMSRKNKYDMLGVVKLRFHVPITSEKWILSSIGDKWKNWKHCLKYNYWEDSVPLVNLIEQELDERIAFDQWLKLVTYWSSDEAKEVSKRNKKARSKKVMKQRTGKRSFAQVRSKLTKKLGRPPNRHELFGVCFVKPNEESSNPNEESSDVASRKYLKMQELTNQLGEGSEDPIGPNDVFAQTMGPDRPGHVRMMGKGICPSDVWGDLPRRSSSNHILKEQQLQITELKTLVAQLQRCGDSQVAQHRLSTKSLSSNRGATNLPLMVTAMSMGDNFEHEMAAKVEQLYNLAYDKAKMLLQKNYVVLEKIVEELLEYEILTGKDLERIVEKNGGIKEKEPFFLSNASCEEETYGRSLDGNAPAIALLSSTN